MLTERPKRLPQAPASCHSVSKGAAKSVTGEYAIPSAPLAGVRRGCMPASAPIHRGPLRCGASSGWARRGLRYGYITSK